MELVEGICYRVTDDDADLMNPDVILILGGRAMPKIPNNCRGRSQDDQGDWNRRDGAGVIFY